MPVPITLIERFKNIDLAGIESFIDSQAEVLQEKDLLGRAVRHGDLSVVQLVYRLGAQNVQDAIGYIVYGEKREIAEFLVEKGANPFKAHPDGAVPIAACEVLNSYALQLALELADEPLPFDIGQQCIAMLLSTYTRNIQEKSACFDILEDNGIPIADTLMMAVHRGDVQSVADRITANPSLLNRLFSEAEIYPPELGIHSGDGLHLTPLEGTSLVHLAVEFQDTNMLKMLLEAGANPNLPALIDANGFGGHTPLYQTVVSYPPHQPELMELLVAYGGAASTSVNLRKELRYLNEPELEQPMVFKEVSPLEYAQQYPLERWINYRALAVLSR